MPKHRGLRHDRTAVWFGLLAVAGAASACGLGCSSLASDEPLGSDRLELINCGTELGVAPLDNICGHGWVGPFGDPGGVGSPATPVVASSVLDFPELEPSLSETQTLYRVALPGSGQSAVKFRPLFSQDYAVVADAAVPFIVLDATGTQVSPVLEQNIGAECAARRDELANPTGVALQTARVYRLASDRVYRIVFGPTALTSVNVLIDEPNDFLNLYFVDADSDTYGDWDRPVASECVAPTGTVADDRDCNDTDAAVNPAAAETVDGVDNDCDGLVDTPADGDLEMVSVSAGSAVRRLLVGESATVAVDEVVKNRGTHAMDASVTRTATASGGGTISPASSSAAVDDLQSFEERELSAEYTVTCTALGTATFTVDAQIAPVSGTDSNLDNNDGTATFSVECVSCVHAIEALVLGDRTHVTSAHVLGGRYLEVGADEATLTTSTGARVDGNARLRSTSRVEGNLTIAGTIQTDGTNFTVTGALLQNTPVTIPPIASFAVLVGSSDVTVDDDGDAAIAPGSYDDGVFGSGSSIRLRAGAYHFRTLDIQPDVEILLDTSLGDIFVNTEEALGFGDRSYLVVSGSGRAGFYTNAVGTVRVGTDVGLDASLSAPGATVHVFSRTTIDGCTSGNRLVYEPDVTQTGSGMPTGDPSGGTPPPTPSCTDGRQNGTETGTDCGGDCAACPTCSDGAQNGAETGMDCGGSCPTACATCSDGAQNGTETGVDCGGSCAACPTCSAATYQAETMFHSAGNSTTGGWNLHSNGYIATNHNFSGGLTRISVVAAGTIAAGVGPHMVVTVGGAPVGNVTLSNTSYQPFHFDFSTTAGNKQIRIIFDNDLFANGQDRNLLLDSAAVSCPSPSPTLNGTLSITNNWGSGYCATLSITNGGTAAAPSWTALIDTRQSTIYTSWNGVFTGSTGAVTIRPQNWNSVVAPGGTLNSVGFCANRNPGTSNVPTVTSVTSP